MASQRGRSYSQDLRERVLAADGLTSRQAAERFSVSVSYVIKARQRRDRTGVLTTKPRGYRRPPRLAGLDQEIAGHVEQHSSATLADVRAWLASTRGVSVSTGTMWRTLRKLGLTLKKRMARPVCNGEIGWRVGLHQRIRSQGIDPGQDGFRAFQAS
jgi:transposase